MRSAALILASSLALACATPVELEFDTASDFSRYQTWDWLPGDALSVHAPFANDFHVEQELGRLVERELAARGLVREREHPDLLVGLTLAARREYRVARERGAVASLPSFHSDKGYEVQAAETEVHRFERFRLALYLSDAQARAIVWQGALEERSTSDLLPLLDAAVGRILERYPPEAR